MVSLASIANFFSIAKLPFARGENFWLLREQISYDNELNLRGDSREASRDCKIRLFVSAHHSFHIS